MLGGFSVDSVVLDVLVELHDFDLGIVRKGCGTPPVLIIAHFLSERIKSVWYRVIEKDFARRHGKVSETDS